MSITFDRLYSYLSGPFLLYDPLTAPGVLLSRAVQQIPFLHAGRTWALFAWKHEGMLP